MLLLQSEKINFYIMESLIGFFKPLNFSKNRSISDKNVFQITKLG